MVHVIRTDPFLDAYVTVWLLCLKVASGLEVTRVGDDAVLHACDPGDDAVTAPRSALDALTLASVRGAVLGSAIEGGSDEEFATCYADAVLEAFTLEELTSEEVPADIDARMAEAGRSCV